MLKKLNLRLRLFDLYLLVFLLPLAINPWGLTYYELPKIFFLRIFLGIFLLAAVVIFLKRESLPFYAGKKTTILLGLWFLSLLVSTIFSIAPALSFWGSYDRIQGFLSQIFYILHFVIIYQYIREEGAREKLFSMIFWTGAAVALYGILQKCGIYVFKGEENPSFLGRIFSTLGQPNFLGQYLIFPVWIGVYYIRSQLSGNHKILYAAALLLMICIFLMTENRASIFGLTAAFGLYFAFAEDRLEKIRWLVLAALLAGVLAFTVFIAPNTRSIQSRFLIWANTPQIVAGHLLTGSGPETLSLTFPRFYPKELYYYERVTDTPDRAHNEPLDILLNQGVFGIGVYAAAMIAILYISIKRRVLFKDAIFRVTFFAFIATLISNFFSFQMTAHWLLFFTMLALIAVALEKPVTLGIKKNILSVFVAGMIVVSVILNIWQSGRLIAADTVFGNGVEHLAANRNADALRSFITANEINPDQGYLAFYSGHFMAGMGNAAGTPEVLDMAQIFFERSLKFFGQNYEYYLETGRLNSFKKDFAAAAKALEKAGELAPSSPVVIQQWGLMLYRNGEYSQALEKFEKYFAMIPKYWQWGPELNGKTDEEKETYRIFMKTTPGIEETLQATMDCYSKTGQTDKAVYFKYILMK
jgi:hypothetical protein